MKLIEQLHRWRHTFLMQGADPAFVPLTREEFSVAVSDCPYYTRTESFRVGAPPKLFDVDVFLSPFAEEIRQRQIDLPVLQLSETARITDGYMDTHDKALRHRLHAFICHDTTKLILTFEWDCWANFKRKFRLTKWFPVRTRTVTIEGRVLYPYLKVSLPHNKHHVQFQHTK